MKCLSIRAHLKLNMIRKFYCGFYFIQLFFFFSLPFEIFGFVLFGSMDLNYK